MGWYVGVMRSYGHIFNGDISVAKLNKFVEKPIRIILLPIRLQKFVMTMLKISGLTSVLRACQLLKMPVLKTNLEKELR